MLVRATHALRRVVVDGAPGHAAAGAAGELDERLSLELAEERERHLPAADGEGFDPDRRGANRRLVDVDADHTFTSRNLLGVIAVQHAPCHLRYSAA